MFEIVQESFSKVLFQRFHTSYIFCFQSILSWIQLLFFERILFGNFEKFRTHLSILIAVGWHSVCRNISKLIFIFIFSVFCSASIFFGQNQSTFKSSNKVHIFWEGFFFKLVTQFYLNLIRPFQKNWEISTWNIRFWTSSFYFSTHFFIDIPRSI